MSIVLIGARGSGKSTAGRRLADQLWQTFIDIDERIVARAGKTIKDIFEEDGEPAFRNHETEVLRLVIPMADQVIALGGGTLMAEENRALLKAARHRVIYLKCAPEELHRRIQADPQTAASRPALTAYAGGIEEIEHLLALREPIYRQCMTAELDVTHLTPEEAAVYIVRMI